MKRTAETLPKTDGRDELPGVVLVEHKRCGKAGCRCAGGRPEDLHGPYFYRYWRENGRLRKAYVTREEVRQVSAACLRRRVRRMDERRQRARAAAYLQASSERLQDVEEMLEQMRGSDGEE